MTLNATATTGVFSRDQFETVFSHVADWEGVVDRVCVYARIRDGDMLGYYLERLDAASVNNHPIMGGMELCRIETDDHDPTWAEYHSEARAKHIAATIEAICCGSGDSALLIQESETKDGAWTKAVYHDYTPPDWNQHKRFWQILHATGKTIWLDQPIIWANTIDNKKAVELQTRMIKATTLACPGVKFAAAYNGNYPAPPGDPHRAAWAKHVIAAGGDAPSNRLYIAGPDGFWDGQKTWMYEPAAQFCRENPGSFLYVKQSAWATAAQGFKACEVAKGNV